MSISEFKIFMEFLTLENIFSCFLNDQAKQTDVQTYFCKPIYSENDLADRTEAGAKNIV
jgi:hypothetical protein